MEAVDLLWLIANHHYDEGWRYNAIQQLINFGLLDQLDICSLMAKEGDPDIRALLEDAGYF